MAPQLRIKLLANVDVTAAETFLAKECAKPKASIPVIENSLLEATEKFLEKLGTQGDRAEAAENSWIDFKKLAECQKATAAIAEQPPRSRAATVISSLGQAWQHSKGTPHIAYVDCSRNAT